MSLINKEFAIAVFALGLVSGYLDAVPYEFWPVWARPIEGNVLSKIKPDGEGDT